MAYMCVWVRERELYRIGREREKILWNCIYNRHIGAKAQPQNQSSTHGARLLMPCRTNRNTGLVVALEHTAALGQAYSQDDLGFGPVSSSPRCAWQTVTTRAILTLCQQTKHSSSLPPPSSPPHADVLVTCTHSCASTSSSTRAHARITDSCLYY